MVYDPSKPNAAQGLIRRTGTGVQEEPGSPNAEQSTTTPAPGYFTMFYNAAARVASYTCMNCFVSEEQDLSDTKPFLGKNKKTM